MFWFNKKKDKKDKKNDINSNDFMENSQEEENFAITAIEDHALQPEKDSKKSNKNNDKTKPVDFSAFYELADLLNSTVENVIEGSCLYQTKKIMSRIGKAVISGNHSEKELSNLIINCDLLGVKEILVSPSFIPSFAKLTAKRGLKQLYVGALIDFPFGESSFKGKLADINDCKKYGVDGVTVVFPVSMASKERCKELKRQAKKISRLYKSDAGVAISAMELDEEGIKNVIKIVESTKVGFITFIFGEVEGNALKDKLKEIKKYRGKKAIKIMGSVSYAEAIRELNAMGIDEVITPYADDIGKQLIKRFKIKSIRLH